MFVCEESNEGRRREGNELKPEGLQTTPGSRAGVAGHRNRSVWPRRIGESPAPPWPPESMPRHLREHAALVRPKKATWIGLMTLKCNLNNAQWRSQVNEGGMLSEERWRYCFTCLPNAAATKACKWQG